MQSDNQTPSVTTLSNSPVTSQSPQSAPNPLLTFLNQEASQPIAGKEARAPSIDPQAVSNQVAVETTPAAPPQTTVKLSVDNKPQPGDSNLNPEPTFFKEESAESSEPKQEALAAENPAEDPEVAELLDPSAENFKKLRTNFKETKKTLKELQAAKATLESDLEKYKTGEIVPGILQEKELEIERLKGFEKIHNLKASKEYEDKYIRPINESQGKLKDIFRDYGVPEGDLDGVVNKALSLTNRAQLNRFLIDHLGTDELGANEAKDVIGKLRAVQTEAKAAEAEPEKILSRLQEESKAVREVREQARRESISKIARNSWVDTVMEIRKEGKITELIPRENDPEFNEGYVGPIMTQASQAYGKIVTELAKAGVTEVTPELGKALAKMTLLAHSTSIAIETRNRAIAQVDELTHNLDRTHTLTRPPLGGGRPPAPVASKPNLATTPEEDALATLRQVGVKV